MEYAFNYGGSVLEVKTLMFKACSPRKVVFNDPATIVFWDDGTKTVVRCQEGDVFDEREGFLLCCAKKLMGNKGGYNSLMRGLEVPDRHGRDMCMRRIGELMGDGAE